MGVGMQSVYRTNTEIKAEMVVLTNIICADGNIKKPGSVGMSVKYHSTQ